MAKLFSVVACLSLCTNYASKPSRVRLLRLKIFECVDKKCWGTLAWTSGYTPKNLTFQPSEKKYKTNTFGQVHFDIGFAQNTLTIFAHTRTSCKASKRWKSSNFLVRYSKMLTPYGTMCSWCLLHFCNLFSSSMYHATFNIYYKLLQNNDSVVCWLPCVNGCKGA